MYPHASTIYRPTERIKLTFAYTNTKFTTFPLLAIKIHFTGKRQPKEKMRIEKLLHQPIILPSKILYNLKH